MLDPSYITVILLGVSLALCLYLIHLFRTSFQYWKKRNVPYLTPTIPFGNALDLFLGKTTFGEVFGNAYLEFKKQGLKHGGIYYLQTPVYIPVDPNIVKKILITDAYNFPNHGMYVNQKDDPLSNHIFNMEGGYWRSLRSKMPANFTSAKMRRMYNIMLELAEPYKQLLEQNAQVGEPMDIKTLVARFTTDIVSACAFGMESKTMENENQDLLKHGRLFFDYQWSRWKNTLVVTVPRDILAKLGFRIFRKETQKYVIDMYTNIMEHRKKEGVTRNDLTDSLIKLTERRDEELDFDGKTVLEPLDIPNFASQMFVFFAAGFETSSSTQTFALYELAKNKHCQDMLRKEINDVLRRHGNELTYDAIMDMKYLENVIDETLRLYPVFPILPRICKEDYPIPGTDVVLEKNTFVMVTNMGIQRDPEYYPNPEQFNPDNFNVENKGTRPHVANIPFGEGPRICVGKRFGLLQTKLGLVTLIKNFEVSLNKKTTEGFQFEADQLILRKKGDVWLDIKKIE
ncbi:unnamed protein product [Phaedon cochleariae]|uniref:Cytochrome P450 n=1 Tax=Phaedon cochleariae TaxID=80249 RepID=A0A9P0DN70_PHACE|nr:unnamed protein product [Phaedon cochleariae]